MFLLSLRFHVFAARRLSKNPKTATEELKDTHEGAQQGPKRGPKIRKRGPRMVQESSKRPQGQNIMRALS